MNFYQHIVENPDLYVSDIEYERTFGRPRPAEIKKIIDKAKEQSKK